MKALEVLAGAELEMLLVRNKRPVLDGTAECRADAVW